MTTDDIEKYFGSAEKVADFFRITSEAVYPAGPRGSSRHLANIHQRIRMPRRAVALTSLSWRVSQGPALLTH